MRHSRQYAVVLLLTPFVLLGAGQLHGDIIIDEFSDVDEVILPQMNRDYVQREGVGSIVARRSLRFVAFDTDPSGTWKVASNGANSLIGELNELKPRWSGDRTVHLQFWYDFPNFDATDGGKYDAFLLDFISIDSGNTASVELRTFVGDDFSSRYNRTIAVPPRAGPFTLALPFSLFREGVNPIEPKFEQLESVHFGIAVRAPIDQNTLNFAMELERVRIGRVVPEPEGMLPWLSGAFCIIAFNVLRRRKALPSELTSGLR